MTCNNIHEPMDAEDLAAHPAVSGVFSVHPQLGPGSVYRVVNDADATFDLFTKDAVHARLTADLLNAAAYQLVDEPRPASTTLSAIQRAAAIGVELHMKRAQLVALEASAGGASVGKSVNQAAVSGAPEHQQHQVLSAGIRELQDELISIHNTIVSDLAMAKAGSSEATNAHS